MVFIASLTIQVKSWFSRQLRKHANNGGGGGGATGGEISGGGGVSGQHGVDDRLEDEEEEALLENYEISMFEENLQSAST